MSEQNRNSFSQCWYNTKQTSDENEENYNSGDNYLVWKQILQTGIKRIVWHTVREITNEVFSVHLTGTLFTDPRIWCQYSSRMNLGNIGLNIVSSTGAEPIKPWRICQFRRIFKFVLPA